MDACNMATFRSFYRESISNQLSTVSFSNIDIDKGTGSKIRERRSILTYYYAIKFFNPAFPKFETGARGFHVPSSRDIQTART